MINTFIVLIPLLVTLYITYRVSRKECNLKKGFYYYHVNECLLSNMEFIRSDRNYLYFKFLNTRKEFKLYRKDEYNLRLH